MFYIYIAVVSVHDVSLLKEDLHFLLDSGYLEENATNCLMFFVVSVQAYLEKRKMRWRESGPQSGTEKICNVL